MTSWNEGYVTSIDYTSHYFVELAPSQIAFAALVKGHDVASLQGPLTYCELGCGHGVSTNLAAAANPGMEFHANDFNPAHIAAARRLATAAGLANAHFYEDSFEAFLGQPALPAAFDFIVLHGVYSWVSAENRGHIVRFIREKLRPGGLVMISYNAYPGWSPTAPLRQLMALHGQEASGSVVERAKGGLALIDKLMAANIGYFRRNPSAALQLQQMKSAEPTYLAHEYLNSHWNPFYHADVAEELSQAKLGFLGPAWVLDDLDEVHISAEQARILAEAKSSAMRETLRDFMVNNAFRRDLFVKGKLSMPGAVAADRLRQQRFALRKPRGRAEPRISTNGRDHPLKPEAVDPVLDALALGPKTVRDLLASPGAAPLKDLSRTLLLLIGAGHIAPCLEADGEDARAASTAAFNHALLDQAEWSGDVNSLASPVMGAGLKLSRANMLFLLARQRGEQDAAAFAWRRFAAEGRRLMRDGKALESADDNLAEMRQRHEAFLAEDMPMLEQLRIA